jgi:glycosyltransferase involved in cell wall biosynthesis
MGEVTPKVSVVIPTYNRAHVVGRAIGSVLAQTYQDFEVIVVDDASTDDTEEVVKRFNDSRIRYLRHEKNLGGAVARNTGIKAAHGEYLAFLDSDDEWLPEKLERQMETLQDLPGNWAGVCCGFWLIDGEHVKESIPDWPRSIFDKLLVTCFLNGGSTLVARTEVINSIGGFDERLPRHQDWDLLLRLAEKYELAIVKTPLVRRYMSGRPAADTVREAKRIFMAKHAPKLREKGLYTRRKIVARHWFELAYLYLIERKLGYASLYFLKGICQNPLQRARVYIMLVDAVCGTHLADELSAVKYRLLHKLRSRSTRKPA